MKEPHNYRKVGYSMIVISVSLTIIGLVVWAIGSNYHFGSELMAGQEIEAMTPKQGYNIVSFDHTAPIGSKLKLLDHTGSINDTEKLQDQHQQNANGIPVLIFGNSRVYNVDLMAHAEVAVLTPDQGYNIVFFNHAMPVGAKLAISKHDDMLVNATTDQQHQKEENKDHDISVIIFSSSYKDNLIKVLGSDSSTDAENALITTRNKSAILTNDTIVTGNSVTTSNTGNESVAMTGLNTTSNISVPSNEQGNQTTTNVNQTTTGGNKSINLSENVGIAPK